MTSRHGTIITSDGASDRAGLSSGAGAGADGVHLHQEGLVAQPVHHRCAEGQSQSPAPHTSGVTHTQRGIL